MEWRTAVKLEDKPAYFNYGSNTLSMGSCFSSEIGNRLKDLGFNIEVNPFGVVFNPVSLFQQIQNSISDNVREEFIFQRADRYYHFGSHSQLNGIDQDQLILKVKAAQEKVRDKVKNGTHLFLTFGTAWSYRLKENNAIVANCHKMPADYFTKELIDLEKLKKVSTHLFEQLFELNPELKVLVTVSPVRHKKDGLHENNISKGLLHLYTHHLTNEFKNIDYFPSYELINDELRDYRFFKEDMVHPTEQAINYVLDQFADHSMSDKTIKRLKVQSQLNAANNHKFMNASEEEKQKHQEHIKKLEEKLVKFRL